MHNLYNTDIPLDPIILTELALLLPPCPVTRIRSPWKSEPTLICLSLLGAGSFGKVYHADDLSAIVSPTGYAVKCVDMVRTLSGGGDDSTNKSNPSSTSRNAINPPKYVSILLNEIVIMNQLTCDNVVRYYGCWAEAENSSQLVLDKSRLEKYIQQILQDSSAVASSGSPLSHIFIKMELCHTTLKHYLEKWSHRGDEISILLQIAAGLCYVDNKLFIHRDIKPGNIFCKIEPSGCLTWKLGDFGLAVKISDEGNSGVAGTFTYQSPEMRKHLKYTAKTDLFSLGLVAVEIIHHDRGKFNRFDIFTELRRLEDLERRNYLNRCASGKSHNLIKIINRLLTVSPANRLCSEKLCELLCRVK